MSKGSDLFYELFRVDGGLPTIEWQRSSGELVNTMTCSHMFVYKMLLSCFDYLKGQFSSSELDLRVGLATSCYILKCLEGWRRGSFKGTLPIIHLIEWNYTYPNHSGV